MLLSHRQSFWRDCKDETNDTDKHLGEIQGAFSCPFNGAPKGERKGAGRRIPMQRMPILSDSDMIYWENDAIIMVDGAKQIKIGQYRTSDYGIAVRKCKPDCCGYRDGTR